LTVTAKTFAPDLKTVSVSKNTPPVEFRLGKGHVVRGKVVDREGKGVGGVMVVADGWRGNRSLQWTVNTKGDGTFVWNDAPADEVVIHVLKQGYQSLRQVTVTPAEKERVITLLP